MRKIILTKGLPASGKSTWAKKMIDDNPGVYKRVNKDDLRAMIDNGFWSKQNEKFVLRMRDMLVLNSITSGFDVIVDDTNLNDSHYKTMLSIADNFTNHSAFQESYDSFHRGGGTQPYRSSIAPEWAASRQANMPVFYRTLPTSTQCLIEYPLIMEDHFDPYYYYQRYHKKRVIAGYASYVAAAQSQYTGYDVNLLSTSCPADHARFKNLVNIFDTEAVRKTPANYIILHGNLVSEFLPGKISADMTRIRSIGWCAEKLQKNYGPPVYIDESIIVFDVSKFRYPATK